MATKRIRQWVFGVLAGVSLLVGASVQAAQIAIAAIVGDDVITTTDVNERRDLVMATAGIADTVENQQKITPRIIQSLIDESLQLQEAKNQSLTISDEELEKAIGALAKRGEQQETVRDFIRRKKLSERSFENQLRAQLAWNKVVQRRLKRNVSISKDEVSRAQQAVMAAPGETELRLQAIELRADAKGDDASTRKLIEEIGLQIKAGTDLSAVATRYVKQPNLRYNPPVWVAEKNLPPPLQQALRNLTPGDVSPALRGETSTQFIQLVERRTAPKQADTTEYALKQIAIAVPQKRDKASLLQLEAATKALRADPGSCESDAVPSVGPPTDVQFVRARLGAMSAQQRSIVTRLEVGEVSEPLLGPDAVRLVVLCEKVEPSASSLPDPEAIRQQLFNEKLELEAQKQLRNLRRDVFIDIKGQ